MKIECKWGLVDCRNDDDVDKIICQCAAESDDLWLSGEDKYPCLTMCVNSEKAVLHYFSSEKDGHYQSVGNRYHGGTSEFIAGGEAWGAPNCIVVPLSAAIECAKSFLRIQERPSCIKWEEL